MKVTGSATIHSGRKAVYEALNDPAVLVRTIPGCERLERTGPDEYRMVVSAGVAAIKGTYSGEVRLSGQRPPESFTLSASGTGGPGTVSAEARVTLSDGPDGSTVVSYEADAVVGGMIGGVGQRMLRTVAVKTADEFFAAVDGHLTTPELAVAPASPEAPTTYVRPASAVRPTAAIPAKGDFARGVLFGAAAALLGVLVGGFVARRARNGKP